MTSLSPGWEAVPQPSDIVSYFTESIPFYRRFWHGPTGALHFGMRDGAADDHFAALLHTNRVLADAADVRPGSRVLDAGCGIGGSALWLAGTTCQVTTLNANHDPNFGGINPEPIAKNYATSTKYLSKHPHDICLVTDGDADRVGGMDGRGNPLSTHQLICLLLHHYYANRGARGRMIKALTATSMVDKMCAAYGLPLVETGVGFKYIAAEMIKGDYILGAEESGGIGFQKHIPERDGILAGLVLLEMLATEKTSINKLTAKLEKEFGPHRYARIDTHFPLEKRSALMEFCKNNPPAKLLKSPLKEVKSYDGVKFVSEDGSWLMLRGSGTEPILRIYAEAPSDAGAHRLLQEGVKMTKLV